MVSDDLLGPATLSDIGGNGVSLLACGAIETASVSHLVVAGDLGATITNIATASSVQAPDDTDTNSIDVPTDRKNTRMNSSHLVTSYAAFSSNDVSVGDTITYTYTVENTGTANLTGVMVSDDLLGPATFFF